MGVEFISYILIMHIRLNLPIILSFASPSHAAPQLPGCHQRPSAYNRTDRPRSHCTFRIIHTAHYYTIVLDRKCTVIAGRHP